MKAWMLRFNGVREDGVKMLVAIDGGIFFNDKELLLQVKNSLEKSLLCSNFSKTFICGVLQSGDAVLVSGFVEIGAVALQQREQTSHVIV